MLSRLVFVVCAILCQVIGAPAPATNDVKCFNSTCQCENITSQVYDYNLQKCAYIVGSNCNISVIDSEIKVPDSSSVLTSDCTSNAECNAESLTCQCIEGYEQTEKLECHKVENLVTTNNYVSDYEDIVNILYGKFCDNAADCDSTEDLVCADLSENSTSSICVCQNSTYVYQAGLGCILPYGMNLSQLLIIKETMRRFRKQRKLILLSNGTSMEDSLANRQGLETQSSKSDGSSAKYQILDRNQYQQQNLFGQLPENIQNNPYQNFGIPSSQEITSANNFQNPNSNVNNFQNPNSNVNNFQNPNVNNYPNQNSNINNFPNQNPNPNNFPNQNPSAVNYPNQTPNTIQNAQAPVTQQNQFSPQNNNNRPPPFQGNQNVNGISAQYPNPSSNQFQQPFPPVGQYQQPQISLLSLLFRPLTQLLNPQQNYYGNRNMAPQQHIIVPFKREARAIIAFFARIINTFLPVLRTLDYQISPILTALGNFRYYDRPNSNYGYNNQQNPNYQQNTQGYPVQQNNNPYPGNSVQPAG